MKRSLALSCALAAFTISASSAFARPFRVNELPNGSKHMCRNCHDDDSGKTFNDFGSAARSALDKTGPIQEAHVHWDLLCPYDADDDGWTNGEELGDPDCVWTAGATPAKSAAYLPGHSDSHPPPVCNNGKLDTGEDCEGSMMSSTDCMDESAGNGTLGCTPDCVFDFSACSAPPGRSSGSGVTEDGGETGGGCAVSSATDDAGSLVTIGLALGAAGTLRRSRARRSKPRLPSQR